MTLPALAVVGRHDEMLLAEPRRGAVVRAKPSSRSIRP
jgi:hypothetical protein